MWPQWLAVLTAIGLSVFTSSYFGRAQTSQREKEACAKLATVRPFLVRCKQDARPGSIWPFEPFEPLVCAYCTRRLQLSRRVCLDKLHSRARLPIDSSVSLVSSNRQARLDGLPDAQLEPMLRTILSAPEACIAPRPVPSSKWRRAEHHTAGRTSRPSKTLTTLLSEFGQFGQQPKQRQRLQAS